MATIAVAAPVAVTAVSAVLLRTRPAEPPRPTLALRILGEPPLWPATEATRSMGELFGGTPDSWGPAPPADPVGVTIVGRRRALDVESLIEDAIRYARAQAPGDGFAAAMAIGSQWAPPTPADHERFDAEVDASVDRVREWLSEVDAFLNERARLLVAELVQTNPTHWQWRASTPRDPPGTVLRCSRPDSLQSNPCRCGSRTTGASTAGSRSTTRARPSATASAK